MAGIILQASSPGIPHSHPLPSTNFRLLFWSLNLSRCLWRRRSSISQLRKQPWDGAANSSQDRTLAGDKLLPQHFCLHRLSFLGPGLPFFPTPYNQAAPGIRQAICQEKQPRTNGKPNGNSAGKQYFSLCSRSASNQPQSPVLPPFFCVWSFFNSPMFVSGAPQKGCFPFTLGNRCSEVSKAMEETWPASPQASAGSTGGYRGALQCCKPAHFHLQPNFTSKEAHSSFQVTLVTKASPLPDTASTTVPTSISHWCSAGFAATWAQACYSYPGNL